MAIQTGKWNCLVLINIASTGVVDRELGSGDLGLGELGNCGIGELGTLGLVHRVYIEAQLRLQSCETEDLGVGDLGTGYLGNGGLCNGLGTWGLGSWGWGNWATGESCNLGMAETGELGIGNGGYIEAPSWGLQSWENVGRCASR